MSLRDTVLGGALMVAPIGTVIVGTLLGAGSWIVLVAVLVFFVGGWLNERFPPRLERPEELT